jgi:uncharacterized membrane protein (UPF0127 family)
MRRALLCLILAACAAEIPAHPSRVLVPTRAGDGSRSEAVVEVEVAATPEARARGLMERDHLPDGRGMLFIFDSDADHRFWMRNTWIPLDMIFIAADGRIVGLVDSAPPLDPTPRGVGAPSRYVLEVPGGWSGRVGLDTGGRVRFR